MQNTEAIKQLLEGMSPVDIVNHERFKEYVVTTRRIKLIEECYRKSCITYRQHRRSSGNAKNDSYEAALGFKNLLIYIRLKSDELLNKIFIASNKLSEEECDRLKATDYTHPSEKKIELLREEISVFTKVLENHSLSKEQKYFMQKHLSETQLKLSGVTDVFVNLRDIKSDLQRHADFHAKIIAKCQKELVNNELEYAKGKSSYWKMIGLKNFYNAQLDEARADFNVFVELISEIVGVYLTKENWDD